MPRKLPSIMGAMKLKKKQLLVALNESGDGVLIAQSDWTRQHDIFENGMDLDENGVESGWTVGLSVGIYLVDYEVTAPQLTV